MTVLTHLPPELLHNILSDVDPEDLARISLTCRSLNNFVKGNNALCRSIYLRILDEPPAKDLNFEQELHDLLTLKELCSPKSGKRGREAQDRLPFVYSTVTRLLRHAVAVPAPTADTKTATTRHSRAQTFPTSRNAALLASLFASRSARVNFLSRSFIYERARALQLAGIDDQPHSLASYPAESGSESDPEDESNGNGNGGSSSSNSGEATAADSSEAHRSSCRRRRRRPRASQTPYGWRTPRRARAEYQLSAKLHCLYGWGLGFEDGGTPGEESREARMRAVWSARRGRGVYPVACAKVYDVRECTRGNGWGPFLEDGVSVDWEKMEAIMVVLGTNIRSKGLERFPIFWLFWGKPFAGCWGKSYIPWSREMEQRGRGKGNNKDTEKDDDNNDDDDDDEAAAKRKADQATNQLDPYGISGSWLRVVSFLDYSDFFSFNFPILDRLPRDVPRAPLDAGQATRLILMRIRATKVSPPGPADHPSFPVTHFAGFSRALDASWDDTGRSDLRGTVRTTPEGEVRWTSYSVFDGQERWKSEGVQVGGAGSARGVVGTWFDKDYEPQGPCGPTAFWKISDRGEGSAGDEKAQVLLEDLFPLIADDMEEELTSEDGEELGEEGVYHDMDPLEAAYAQWELEEELEGMHYFDEEDVFDVEDILDEVAGLPDVSEDDVEGDDEEGGDEADYDEDEDEDYDDDYDDQGWGGGDPDYDYY